MRPVYQQVYRHSNLRVLTGKQPRPTGPRPHNSGIWSHCMAVPFSSNASSLSLSATKDLPQAMAAEEETRRRSVLPPSHSRRMMATLAPLPRCFPINQNQNPNQKIPHDRRYFSSVSTRQEENDKSSVTITTTIPFFLLKELELPQWFVQEGDRVHQFDTVFEVQPDQATVEMSSRYDGVMEDLAGLAVGDMVAVGSPFLLEEELGSAANYY